MHRHLWDHGVGMHPLLPSRNVTCCLVQPPEHVSRMGYARNRRDGKEHRCLTNAVARLGKSSVNNFLRKTCGLAPVRLLE